MNKTIVITGASSGVGEAAARRLAVEGARIVVVGRDPRRTDAVADSLGAQRHVADFARLSDVHDLAAQLNKLDRIDVLANNAGGLFPERAITEDGLERTFQVNHLAGFLLTRLLRDKLVASGASVIQTSSMAHYGGRMDLADPQLERGWSSWKAYNNAKLANVLFTRSLHAKFHDQGISSAAFHPGLVRTSFSAGSHSPMRWLYQSPLARLAPMNSPERGGATLAWFLTGTPGSTWTSGRYYDQDRPTMAVNPQADDLELPEALRQRSAEQVGLPHTA